MSGRNRRLLLPISSLFLAGIFCIRVLAQTPAVANPPAFPNATDNPSSSSSSSHLLANSNIKLGAGDLIDVSVYGVPDLSTKTRVSGSGDIYLPLVDYVHVADLTTDEAQELIQKRLED